MKTFAYLKQDPSGFFVICPQEEAHGYFLADVDPLTGSYVTVPNVAVLAVPSSRLNVGFSSSDKSTAGAKAVQDSPEVAAKRMESATRKVSPLQWVSGTFLVTLGFAGRAHISSLWTLPVVIGAAILADACAEHWRLWKP